MINRKPALPRNQQCQYLASRYGEALVLSAYNDTLPLPSRAVAVLTGYLAEPAKQFILADVLNLLPVKDTTPTRSAAIRHNALFLSKLFDMPESAAKVIEFIIVLNVNDGLRTLLDVLLDEDSDALERLLCAESGLDIRTILSYLGILEQYQLISAAMLHSAYYLNLPSILLPKLVNNKLKQPDELLASIVRLSPDAKFTVKQFMHVNADLLLRYLKAATKQRIRGVNILLYGKAGTGKTELARSLAKAMGFNLLEVISTQLEDGRLADEFQTKDPARHRISYMNLLQGLLKESQRSMLLVDECEGLFLKVDEGYSKEAFMRLLENNALPAIWITNYVELLEPSYLRRFKLVMELPIPDEEFAYRMSKTILAPLKVSDDFALGLAANTNASPAIIANSAHVASTLLLTGEQAEDIILEVMGATLEACGEEGPLPKYEGQLVFDPSCLNFIATEGHDAQTLINDVDSAIANGLPLRVLLSGPPGTGKTGWVHHLAEMHGFEVMHIKCSDVLSKYVGESEQNISALFRTAHKEQKLMLFDEVDSLLCKRESAQALHEVQLVNELLSQLECNTVPVFAATNALTSIDSAVMRRFDFKLACDYLTSLQCHKLYRQVLGIKKLTQAEKNQLSQLQQLTPGDFAILARRMLFQPNHNHRTTAIDLLTAENNHKQVKRQIGFTR
jgi:transitional endoplasmic reticulum ATPase